MKIALLTVHAADSARKVDFHFWKDVFCARGAKVDFVSVGLSLSTLFKSRSHRYTRPYNHWIILDEYARKFIWCPVIHPFSLGNALLNRLAHKLFSFYPTLMPGTLLTGLAGTDIFIVENGAGLLLVPALKKRFPQAKFIYSVCDRIETLGYHPIILEAEKEALDYFNLVRVPAKVMIDDYPKEYNVHYIPHGLDKASFDNCTANPYTKDKNIVSVGDMLFDAESIAIMADCFPDWTFHLFGKKAFLPVSKSNVITHGEKPLAEIAPYIKFADIGLAPYTDAPNADYLSQSSMKMIQYSYCKLPILAPAFASAGREHVFAYRPGDPESITDAINNALNCNRAAIDSSDVLTWEETVDAMLNGMTDSQWDMAAHRKNA